MTQQNCWGQETLSPRKAEYSLQVFCFCFSFHFSHVCVCTPACTCLHTLCGYRCTYLCVHMSLCACRGLRLKSGIHLNCSSNLFTETGSLNQTQSSLSSSACSGDPLPLPPEAGITGRPPFIWALQSSHLNNKYLMSKPSIQPHTCFCWVESVVLRLSPIPTPSYWPMADAPPS